MIVLRATPLRLACRRWLGASATDGILPHVAALSSPPHHMANIHSQKKRILRTERERLENRRYTSTIRTYFRRLEAAVAEGDDAAADAEHRR